MHVAAWCLFTATQEVDYYGMFVDVMREERNKYHFVGVLLTLDKICVTIILCCGLIKVTAEFLECLGIVGAHIFREIIFFVMSVLHHTRPIIKQDGERSNTGGSPTFILPPAISL